MNVNKKFGRFKQWAGERMGGEVKTNVSDDFKAMEAEMNLRHEGMERLQKSTTMYIKAMSKRNEGDDKEKNLPVGYLGGTMVNHGEDFDGSSEFGQCLVRFGRTQERIARIQESYVANATASWVESLERSLTQMKEYQNARKKLENRRLAYDTSLAKIQKAKREDFRAEEELRTQKVKYEESSEDVYRRMEDIREAEPESVTDLRAFLDAELEYYDRCRDVLLQLRDDWPAQTQNANSSRRSARSRSNTAHSYHERYAPVVEEPPPVPTPEPRPTIRSSGTTPTYQGESPPRSRSRARDYSPDTAPRPPYTRTPTFEGPSQLRRDLSPVPAQRITRAPSDSNVIRNTRSQLRTVSTPAVTVDPYANSADENNHNGYYTATTTSSSSPDGYLAPEFSTSSPTTSVNGNGMPSLRSSSPGAKKGPPPPPPSRAKKPPPPPPPVKRNVVAGGM